MLVFGWGLILKLHILNSLTQEFILLHLGNPEAVDNHQIVFFTSRILLFRMEQSTVFIKAGFHH